MKQWVTSLINVEEEHDLHLEFSHENQNSNFCFSFPGTSLIKLFTAVINYHHNKLECFFTVSHLCPSLLFVGGKEYLRVEYPKGLHSGTIQPCLQILDLV
jgi:hypothetical protein